MLIVYDEEYTRHLAGTNHPEAPDRVRIVAERLRAQGMLDECLAPRRASVDELTLVHPAGYVERVRREVDALGDAGRAAYLSTGDTVIDKSSFEVASSAAGGVLLAAECVAAEKRAAFALVRPPGHHAEPARGMGFCVFNNAGLAARSYAARSGRGALIVDFDYHHGNGSQAIVGKGVSYVSSHASPAYPGTGSSSENRYDPEGAIVNFPLPVTGYETEAFVALWEQALGTLARALHPGLIVASAGYDFVAGDPVGDLGIAPAAASSLARIIRQIADEHCEGRALFVLEGGYDPRVLADCVVATIRGYESGSDELGAASAQAVPRREQAVLERLSGAFARG
ncbi:MAG TPA: histone deacetylase [Candidatus Binatia bacterium]|nr:histone deacetylase [Candidatus Binatia bacterium]